MSEMSGRKAWTPEGVDWIEVTIPPQPGDDDVAYSIRVHASFLMSNWSCIYGRGCPGMFGKQSSTFPEDAGCCGNSFYFADEDDVEFVTARVAELTSEDWDEAQRKHVEKHGFIRDKGSAKGFNLKGKTNDGACVFLNRNGGSTGKPGCAFHHLGERTGREHVDVMPRVCWQLPLRYGLANDSEECTTYELGPWDIAKWFAPLYEYADWGVACSWWCVDMPEAYSGSQPVYKAMERELRELLGGHAYEVVVAALEARTARGVSFAPMPGSVRNDGRPLIPLLVGNREPVRQPSPYPAILAKMKEQDHVD